MSCNSKSLYMEVESGWFDELADAEVNCVKRYDERRSEVLNEIYSQDGEITEELTYSLEQEENIDLNGKVKYKFYAKGEIVFEVCDDKVNNVFILSTSEVITLAELRNIPDSKIDIMDVEKSLLAIIKNKYPDEVSETKKKEYIIVRDLIAINSEIVLGEEIPNVIPNSVQSLKKDYKWCTSRDSEPDKIKTTFTREEGVTLTYTKKLTTKTTLSCDVKFKFFGTETSIGLKTEKSVDMTNVSAYSSKRTFVESRESSFVMVANTIGYYKKLLIRRYSVLPFEGKVIFDGIIVRKISEKQSGVIPQLPPQYTDRCQRNPSACRYNKSGWMVNMEEVKLSTLLSENERTFDISGYYEGVNNEEEKIERYDTPC